MNTRPFSWVATVDHRKHESHSFRGLNGCAGICASVKDTAYESMHGEKVSVCEIRVKEHLGGWSEWFDGWEIYNMENGEAVLSGEIVDQAALRGVLAKGARTWDCRWLL